MAKHYHPKRLLVESYNYNLVEKFVEATPNP
jgi:hypothetical protein